LKPIFAGAQDLFSTMHILASLPENQLAPSALRHVSRQALYCGSMVPEEISESPLAKIGFIQGVLR
jgi:hypothetical protein